MQMEVRSGLATISLLPSSYVVASLIKYPSGAIPIHDHTFVDVPLRSFQRLFSPLDLALDTWVTVNETWFVQSECWPSAV